jgi:GT2 family glycosyltransferase
MKYDIVCSLVIYKNSRIQLLEAINSFLNTNLDVFIVLIDNSPNDNLRDIKVDVRLEYIHNGNNLGYGSAHNLAIKKYSDLSRFHLILNPDIFYFRGVIEDILFFMENNEEIGLLMPKVLYPNGNIQYLAKLIPSPFDFFWRRFIPISLRNNKISQKFELRFSGYDSIMQAPYLSGCFMVFRSEALKSIDGFDEKFFMHMEDLDISRRCMQAGYKTVFYPNQIVYHDHLYKTFLTKANFKMYITSAYYYFNKWGWFCDKDRKIVNRQIIKMIREKRY